MFFIKNNTLNYIYINILFCLLIACDNDAQKTGASTTSNLESQYQLAQEYLSNSAGKNDVVQAIKILEQLSVQGYAPAQNKLGFLYSQGIHVQKDLSFAFQWYEKAANAGFSISQFNLAEMYRFGYGSDKDDLLAFYWYEKSALQGYPNAMLRMAESYKTGTGTEEDLVKAYAWYQLAKNNNINVPDPFMNNLSNQLSDQQHQGATDLLAELKWEIAVNE